MKKLILFPIKFFAIEFTVFLRANWKTLRSESNAKFN